MKVVKAVANNKSFGIGRRGENIARQIVFDLSDFVAEYGEGTPELIFQRPIDDKPYPVAAVRDGSTLLWTVTDLDTAVATTNGGYSHCELRWYVGELLAKSQTWLVYVDTAMNVPSETVPPDPESGWVDQVLATGAESKASAESAKSSADASAASETAAKASETAAKASEVAAAGSASSAQQSATSAAESAAVYGNVVAYVNQLKQDLSSEQTAREQADTSLQKDIFGKLPKSPTDWEAWTAEEQAVARDRMGAVSATDVSTAITEALSAIGVAEEGAY